MAFRLNVSPKRKAKIAQEFKENMAKCREIIDYMRANKCKRYEAARACGWTPAKFNALVNRSYNGRGQIPRWISREIYELEGKNQDE